MSLYDDMDSVKQKTEQVAGWSSGIKLLQSQLQLKKAVGLQAQPRNSSHKKLGATLAPVIDLKSRKDDDDPNISKAAFSNFQSIGLKEVSLGMRYQPQSQTTPARDPDWNMVGEYDPMWPNDYEKVVKDLRDIREREKEKEDEERRKRSREERDKRQRDRFEGGGPTTGFGGGEDRRKSGFAGRNNSDEEEEEKPMAARTGGAAIAPPASLQESSGDSPRGGGVNANQYQSGASVAAKIMAKYGFKEGQGLGKSEQGISMALQVEKTSKRGGRIIHEKEIMPPPSLVSGVGSPSSASQVQPKPEPSITEIMRSPTKVVLLRNMVGPGEVDEDLEPEVKDECNTKYGDVIRVSINELPNVHHEEAVRIFVEFKRIESAIKAVVDLNGRFFGGRQVKAGFYSWEKFNSGELLE